VSLKKLYCIGVLYIATAEAKKPRLRMTARPMRVCRFTRKRHTIGIGISAKRRSVAMLTEELNTPTFLKAPGL
jgi:hypothetical protein